MRYTYIVYKKIKVPDSYQAKPKRPKKYLAAMLLLGVGGYAASALWNRSAQVTSPPSSTTQVDPDTESNAPADHSLPTLKQGRGLASVETDKGPSRQKNGIDGKSGTGSNSADSSQTASQSESNLGIAGTNPRSNSIERPSRGLASYANNIPSSAPAKKPESLAESNNQDSNGSTSVPLVGNLPASTPTTYNHSSDGGQYPGQSSTRTQGILLNRNFGILTSGGGLAKSSQIQIISQLGNVLAPNLTKSSQLQVHNGITAFNE